VLTQKQTQVNGVGLVGCFWVFSGVGGMEGFGRFVALQAKGNFQFEYFSC